MTAWEYETWFSGASVKEMNGGSVVLSVPNKFFASWIGERYLHSLEDSFSKILKCSPRIVFEYAEAPVQSKAPEDRLSVQSGLDPSLRLESYFTGDWNRFPVSSAMELTNETQCPYNPFYVYSGTGLGKTHLLHGIGNRFLQKNDTLSVRYVNSTQFAADFIHSWRNDQYPSFLERYSDLDVLLFDNIHLLANRPKTQRAFVGVFDAVQSRNGKLVVSGDRGPYDLLHTTDTLRSRLGSGLVAEIHEPDQSSLLALTRKKAQEENTNLPEDVLFFLAHESRDVRGLFRRLIKLQSYSSLTGRAINLSLAKSIVKRSPGNQVLIEDIKAVTAGYFNISSRDLSSGKKKRVHSYPRQLAMYLARKYTHLPCREIGESFGHRDHSTVVYAVRRVEKEKDSVGAVSEDLKRLEDLLG